MSAEFWNKLKHTQAEIAALREMVDKLSDRVLKLEADEPSPTSQDVDIDTLEVVPKRRGRPPKVQP